MKINKEKFKYNIKDLMELYYDKKLDLDLTIKELLPLISGLDHPFLNILGLREFLRSENRKYFSGSFYVESNLLYFKLESHIFKVGVKHSDFQLRLGSIEEKLLNTNFSEIWMMKYSDSVEDFILGRLHSRHLVRSEYEFLKDILKSRWIPKLFLKKHLLEIISKYGITTKPFTLRSGKQKHGVVPSCTMIHMSVKSSVKAECDWEESFPEEYIEKDLFIQGGESGIVISKEGNYSTAFVEVFPSFIKNGENSFSTFIRGEGQTIKEAELDAYNKVLNAKKCNHEWKRFRDRDNGHGICKKCSVFHSKALLPSTLCKVCNKPVTGFVNGKSHFCFDHFFELKSSKIIKTEHQNRDYYKGRTSSQFRHEVRGVTNKKELKKEYKRVSNTLKSNDRNYYIDMAFKYPKFTHLVRKKLYKQGILTEENMKDHKLSMKIYKVVFDCLSKNSILYNRKSNIINWHLNLDRILLNEFSFHTKK